MRGGTLISFDDYPILKNNISTLKETSVDKHDKNVIKYMTNSERAAVKYLNLMMHYF